MAKALETSELSESILTISANSEEMRVTLLDPLLARSLLASRDRIEVQKPTNMEFTFYRETPPMSPNLERYGITISHQKGADQNAPIEYLSSKYSLVEVIRPKLGKFYKTVLTVYARLSYEEAREIPEKLELTTGTYRLSHFYMFKCKTCGERGHRGNRYDVLTKKREEWL